MARRVPVLRRHPDRGLPADLPACSPARARRHRRAYPVGPGLRPCLAFAGSRHRGCCPCWPLAISTASFVSTVLSVHLLVILQGRGLALAAAVALGALVGPSQVGARAIELALSQRHHPIWTKLVASSLIVLGLAALLAGGPWLTPALAPLRGRHRPGKHREGDPTARPGGASSLSRGDGPDRPSELDGASSVPTGRVRAVGRRRREWDRHRACGRRRPQRPPVGRASRSRSADPTDPAHLGSRAR